MAEDFLSMRCSSSNDFATHGTLRCFMHGNRGIVKPLADTLGLGEYSRWQTPQKKNCS